MLYIIYTVIHIHIFNLPTNWVMKTLFTYSEDFFYLMTSLKQAVIIPHTQKILFSKGQEPMMIGLLLRYQKPSNLEYKKAFFPLLLELSVNSVSFQIAERESSVSKKEGSSFFYLFFLRKKHHKANLCFTGLD